MVKSILQKLSPCDYPSLNKQLLFTIWLTYILDHRLTSMRALFYRLNHGSIPVAMSTFSKANKTRNTQIFQQIFRQPAEEVKRQNSAVGRLSYPVYSTVRTKSAVLSGALEL